MPEKNKLVAFTVRHAHLLLLGSAGALSLGALVALLKFDASRLNAFGPTAKLYLSGMQHGLTISTTILLISFVVALFFNNPIKKLAEHLNTFYGTLHNRKKNLLVLIVCIVFAFASHAGNIMNGYFNMDDFEVMSLNRTTPLAQAIFIPHGNDHALPLFRAEMKTLDALFGQNQIPYNIFIFALFALIPFFTYLAFKRIGIGLAGFAVFLFLFTGATGWNDMLTGFYIMSIYLQILFFFSVMFWAYLAWEQSREKKYMLFFALAMVGALTADISGVWVVPASVLVMAYASYTKTSRRRLTLGKNNVARFFADNKIPFFVTGGVSAAFAYFLYVTFFIVQPHTFLSVLDGAGIPSASKEESWKFIPLVSNFLSLFASGVSLSLFAPKIAKILTHPAIKESVQEFWSPVELIILAGNALLFWFALKYAKARERKLMFLLFGITLIAITMVIVARPNHETIPDFDYRYAGAAFYAYIIFLALCASLLWKTKEELAKRVIMPLIIIIFSAQQAFGFQAIRDAEESKMRKEAIQNLREKLLPAFESLSKEKNDIPLMIPNLSGKQIFEQTMAGFTLSYYVLFFNNHTPIRLIQNTAMPPDNRTRTVTTVPSLRASTSPEFIEALKMPGAIRSYYLSPTSISYEISTSSSRTPLLQNTKKEIHIREKEFDPEKMHIVKFTILTDNTSGNMELSFSFKNDFGVEGAVGKIRVDDFTPHEIKNGKRLYRIETDLLQLYAYALSKNISRLTISVPNAKNASVSDVYFK